MRGERFNMASLAGARRNEQIPDHLGSIGDSVVGLEVI